MNFFSFNFFCRASLLLVGLYFEHLVIFSLVLFLHECNEFLKFPCGVTPLYLFLANMAAEPFDPNTSTCLQVLVGFKREIRCALHQSCFNHANLAVDNIVYTVSKQTTCNLNSLYCFMTLIIDLVLVLH